MRIKKLILKGFKSFPNKTEIFFSPKITACVGPNGCGKTNIFEGILFALGEKKTQNLRGNTWEDLIFSGNEKISKFLSAEVAIIMENDEEEIEIRRKIYRDGRIENYINEEYVSHLKWDKRIYEILPQGNSYALMKNEDIEKFITDGERHLKELIHSMAGLEFFEKKKETLKRRLLRVQREMERLEDILNLKEKRLDELQKEVFRLKSYWEIKERLNALEKEKNSIYYFYIKREIQKKERDKEILMKEMEIYKEKNYEKLLMEIKKEILAIEEKIKELEDKEKELIQREKELTVEKVRISEKKDNLLLNKNEIERRRKSLLEILKEIEKESISLKEIEFNEEEFKKKGQILKEIEEEVEKIEREKKEIEIKKISIQENIKVLKNRISENKENILREKGKEKVLNEEIEKILKEINEKEILNDENIKKLKEINEKLEKIEEKINEKKINLKGMENRLKSLEKERGIEDEDLFFKFIDLGDEKNFIFEKIFYYPLLSIKDIKEDKILKDKFLIKEKMDEFLNYKIKKISYEESLEKLFENISLLDKDKIYITKDNFIIIDGFIVEKIKKEIFLREKEIKEIKDKLFKENEELNKLMEEYKNLNEEKNNLRKIIEDIDKTLTQKKKELRIKETEYEIAKINLRNFEKIKGKDEKSFEKLTEELNILEEKNKNIWEKLREKKKLNDRIRKDYERMERFRYLMKTYERTYKEIEETQENIKKMDEEINGLTKRNEEIMRKEEEVIKLKEKILEEKNKLLKEKNELEKKKDDISLKIEEIRKKIEILKEEIIKIDVKIEALREKLSEFGEDIEDKVPSRSIKKVEEEIEILNKRLFEFQDVNLAAQKEYEREREEYSKIIESLKDVKDGKKRIEEAIKTLEEEAKRKFWNLYNEFKNKVKEVAKFLLEGDLYIELENPSDPLNSEFLIKASPSGKRVKSLALLSGGERALLALCILFSLYTINPLPFCILDEVDAALDEANTLKFVQFIKNLSARTQFFIITHNKRTMESADILYGVSMEEGVSKIFSLKLESL